MSGLIGPCRGPGPAGPASPGPVPVREQLVGDWWHTASEHGVDAVMVAARGTELDDLNARARTRLAAAGALTGPSLDAAGRQFRVGEWVLCLRNQPGDGVLNGTRGHLTHVDPDRRRVTLVRDDTGEPVNLDAGYLDAGHLTHGYALTAHKAQGLTCDATFVLGSDAIYREWGYVALSRGRHHNRLYLLAGEGHDEPVDDPTHPQLHQPDRRSPAQRLTASLRASRRQTRAPPVWQSVGVELRPSAARPTSRRLSCSNHAGQDEPACPGLIVEGAEPRDGTSFPGGRDNRRRPWDAVARSVVESPAATGFSEC